jgi:hypothetical protein
VIANQFNVVIGAIFSIHFFESALSEERSVLEVDRFAARESMEFLGEGKGSLIFTGKSC